MINKNWSIEIQKKIQDAIQTTSPNAEIMLYNLQFAEQVEQLCSNIDSLIFRKLRKWKFTEDSRYVQESFVNKA